ncbi:DEAD/DEAH box helicase [Aeromicrobium sp. UC242_57]|uniref:DEAD/DEAH box helicase n=1 Tax=Aeromicrobium sp. UC242_57 TaxID=3374624 RepID=UPI0037BA1485
MRAATVDGDNSREERSWARDHANYVLTNPDTLHHSILPAHPRWTRLLAGLTHVVIDECHHYRGVFGAHVAHVLRRLRRICAHYGADPVFVLSSATVSEPEVFAARLTGLDVVPVTDDASPHAARTIALWEPPIIPGIGDDKEGVVRRSATTEAGSCSPTWSSARCAPLPSSGRGAAPRQSPPRRNDVWARSTQARGPGRDVSRRISARGATRARAAAPQRRPSRSGQHKRARLGIDVAGLDAVITVGFPGTRAALQQQLRPGRTVGRLDRHPDRTGRAARHVLGPPSRGSPRSAGRGVGLRPGQSVRPGTSPRCRRPGDPADRGRLRVVRAPGGRGRRGSGGSRLAAQAPGRLVLDQA